MAACTDLAYRLLSREYGLEFCFLEMVAAESLIRDNRATRELMKTVPEDKPLGAQIVGCRPEAMGEAAATIEGMGFDLVDLNLGCPAPKVAGKGAGSALINRPEECRRIFTAVTNSVKKIFRTDLGAKKEFGEWYEGSSVGGSDRAGDDSVDRWYQV